MYLSVHDQITMTGKFREAEFAAAIRCQWKNQILKTQSIKCCRASLKGTTNFLKSAN